MEEYQFATFNPISSLNDSDPETLKNYYLENNLTPTTDMLKNYLGWPVENTISNTFTKNNSIPTSAINIAELLGSTVFTKPETLSANTYNGSYTSPKNPKEFMAKFGPSIEKASQESGISKELLSAQIALETGWGKHMPGFNIGGIKSSKGWNGKTQTLSTQEFENGQYVTKPQTFRAYDSPDEGFQGYVDFLLTNKRYKGLKGIADPNQAAEFMGRSGYATDPQYAAKLKNIIRQIQNI